MRKSYFVGNAPMDGQAYRGWFLGPFVAEPALASEQVEVKWAVHAAGEIRDAWAEGSSSTTLCLLIQGKFQVVFPDGEAVLATAGDYVVWPAGVRHSWQALDESTVLSIRWVPAPAGEGTHGAAGDSGGGAG